MAGELRFGPTGKSWVYVQRGEKVLGTVYRSDGTFRADEDEGIEFTAAELIEIAEFIKAQQRGQETQR